MTKDRQTSLNALQSDLRKTRPPLAASCFKESQRNSSDPAEHATATKPATGVRASVLSKSSSMGKQPANDAIVESSSAQANADKLSKPTATRASVFGSGFGRPPAQTPGNSASAAACSLSSMLMRAEDAAPQDDILALTTFRVTEQRADAVASKPERTSSRSDGTEQQKVSGVAALPMNYGLCTKVHIAAPVGSLDALQAVSAADDLQSAMYFTGGQFHAPQPLVHAANGTAADALTDAVRMFQSATMYWAHPATSLPPLALSTQGNALERVRKVGTYCLLIQKLLVVCFDRHAHITLHQRNSHAKSLRCAQVQIQLQT
jgi:hypothetical protein